MDNARKINPVEKRTDDSETIRKLTDEAFDDWEDIEKIKRWFPRKPRNKNRFKYPFAYDRLPRSMYNW